MLAIKPNTLTRCLAPIVVFVTALALAGPVSANTQHNTSAKSAVSYYRPFPNGVNPSNATSAWQQIANRAAWDNQYASTIASQTGAAAFVATEYRPVGYSNGMPGTTNSALSGAGSIVPLADHAGSGTAKVIVVMNVKTSKTIAFMVRCGNPRLHQSSVVAPLPWHPFRKATVLRIHRTISKPISITCPSGQKVSGSLNVVFNGVVHGTTWGKVQGSLTEKLRIGLTAQIKAFAKLKCGAVPKVLPPVPAPTPTGTCNNVAISVNGNNNTVYVCSVVVTIVCSNASVTIAGPSADVVNNAVQQYEKDNNCNTTVAPPPCTTNCTTPPSFTMSFDTVNDIPLGQCRPETLHVSSSVAGNIKIYPTNGLISTIDCYQPIKAVPSEVTVPINTGDTDVVVYIYEPADLSATSDMLTAVPMVPGVDAKANTATTPPYTISTPNNTRPS